MEKKPAFAFGTDFPSLDSSMERSNLTPPSGFDSFSSDLKEERLRDTASTPMREGNGRGEKESKRRKDKGRGEKRI